MAQVFSYPYPFTFSGPVLEATGAKFRATAGLEAQRSGGRDLTSFSSLIMNRSNSEARYRLVDLFVR
jgi:hypothetical protein